MEWKSTDHSWQSRSLPWKELALPWNDLSMSWNTYAQPTAFSSLAFWHDPSNSASVTLNSGDVSQIDDLSGNGLHATQGTGANQPLLTTKANGSGSREVIQYTGANNDTLLMTGGGNVARNVSGFTFTGIFRPESIGTAQRIWQTSIAGSTSSVRVGITLTTTGALQSNTRCLDADGSANNSSTATMAANTVYFIAVTVNYVGRSVSLQINGTTVTGTPTWTGGVNSSDTASAANGVLYGRIGATLLTGSIGECCAFQRALTAAEINTLRNDYFRPKWGL